MREQPRGDSAASVLGVTVVARARAPALWLSCTISDVGPTGFHVHFSETALRGVYLIDPAPHTDDRGQFMRAWCAREFADHGIGFVPLQANLGTNRRAGTLRGMHWQEAPHDEAKLVRCTRGALFDVCVDLRPGSATFGRWTGAELTAENARALYIPPLCAHGYQTLADESDLYYMTSALYAGASARGLRHDDPAVDIHWPLPPVGVSAQDAAWPFLSQLSRSVSG